MAIGRQMKLVGQTGEYLVAAELGRRFIEIRQWLTAEGEYSDLIVEQGLLQDDDLQTATIIMPFHHTVDQALEKVTTKVRLVQTGNINRPLRETE